MDTDNNNDLKQCTCTGERSCGKTQKVVNDLLKRISNLEFEVEDLEKYKVRCEKAREYIQSTYVTDNPIKFKNTLYEILIGSDKE